MAAAAPQAPVAPVAAASQALSAQLPLDLPLTNAQGELGGGVNPALPTDRATLESLLGQARAQGVEPKRYAALLWQYWLVRATGTAGIDLTTWEPARGVIANDATVAAVYGYYGKTFLAHPDLQWSGMANMIGPAFTAGFKDLGSMADIAALVSGNVRALPSEVQKALPADVRRLAEGKVSLPSDQLRWFESKFLAMQKHIFMDQGAMHEAYLGGGVAAVEEMRAAGLVDDNAVGAWRDIASGDATAVQRGNTALLNREQNQIIDRQWGEMYARDGAVGAVMTYGMTVGGAASIPNTRTPGKYKPLVLSANLLIGRVNLTTSLPNFNISNNAERWAYITKDTLPAYQKLLRDQPAKARQVIGSSFTDRVSDMRLVNRWPSVVADLTTGWRLGIDGVFDSVEPATAPASAPSAVLAH
ncbi:hypothetical protein [Streptomyces sp. NPDC050504]|uniref:hypothetical protein n=1 Tax=Streptomyces sp. NPDC050504 TaxID=3365618 RepID=UPI0037B730E5